MRQHVTTGVKSVKEVLSEAGNVMERLEGGEKVFKQKPGIYFDTLETMRKAITEERIRIIKVYGSGIRYLFMNRQRCFTGTLRMYPTMFTILQTLG